MKQVKFIPSFLRYLILIFLTLMLITSIGRIFLLFQFSELLPGEALSWSMKSIWQGWVFDSTIAAYIIALPFLVLTLMFLFAVPLEKAVTVFGYLFNVFFVIVTIFVMADLPYFAFYNSRLSKGILSWTDSPALMAEAVFTEVGYYPFILLGAVVIFLVIRLNKRLMQRIQLAEPYRFHPVYRLLLFLIMGFILFLGLRGDWDFSEKPITTERAFISDNAFVNQMAMNPVFNFFDSFRALEVKEMNDEEAIREASLFLKADGSECSPLLRHVTGTETGPKKNVVIILVESLSADKVGVNGNKENLTPVLDSLAGIGIFFPKFYASGVHTHNGIFSTLYSLPSILNKKPMADSYLSQLKYSGIPETLKKRGYQTTFSCSGNLNFDNMGSFLKSHGFDDVIGRDHYRKEDIYSSWGVADHVLFDYALEHINKTSSENLPFLHTILTISSHDGYYPPIPEGFKPRSSVRDNHRYEYADWAIGRFLEKASTEDWFSNTIFVILGDHGQNFNPVYELPLSYVHIPLIFYEAGMKQSAVVNNFSLQIDVFPTLMSLLGFSYENNTAGVDLFSVKRPYAYFSSDDYIGCISDEFYWLSGVNGMESLFYWPENQRTNVLLENQKIADAMKRHVYSMLQTSQYMMDHNLTGPCEH